MREAIRAYCATVGITFLPLLDPDGRVATHYHVFLLPSTVFIHPSGTVAAVHNELPRSKLRGINTPKPENIRTMPTGRLGDGVAYTSVLALAF
jgi:hypothetical protein